MATTLGTGLMKQVLGHSDAEKAFRPWWDSFEDYLIYSLILLGLVVLPTAIINGTPLDCQLCTKDICPNLDEGLLDSTDPGYSAWWVKKYCTMTAVDNFILYFPYILLIMALMIVLIEKGFSQAFRAGMKLDQFYNLLMNESFLESGTTTSTNEKGGQVTKFYNVEDSKLAFEVAHSFSDSSSYFWSYFFRTILELLTAIGLQVWIMFWGLPIIKENFFIHCDVHGTDYSCVGHPEEFYKYILFIAIAILFVYIFCCFFNLLWLFVPGIGKLSRVMVSFRDHLRKANPDKVDKQLLGGLYDVYYNNWDLKLLLDLLAASSGIAPCLRVLCLFDKSFRDVFEVDNLTVETFPDENGENLSASVEFDDPAGIKETFSKMSSINIVYTIEIVPPINSGSFQAFKFEHDDEIDALRKLSNTWIGKDESESKHPNDGKKQATFHNIEPDMEHTFRVSTVINGKAIARKMESLKPKHA